MRQVRFVAFILVLCIMFSGVAAVAEQIPPSKGAFYDVPSDHWAYQYIERAFQEGVIEGSSYSETTGVRRYAPDSHLTMAQFGTIMARIENHDELNALIEDGFTWDAAAMWVSWPYIFKPSGDEAKNNLLYIEGNKTKISRLDMAHFMVSYLEKTGRVDTSVFNYENVLQQISDAESIPEKYRKDVAVCYHYGLIEGFSDGSFKGDNVMTRAQAATVYCRFSDLLKDAGSSGLGQLKNGEGYGLMSFSPDEILSEVFRLVNIEREKAGVQPLAYSNYLGDYAQTRTDEVLNNYNLKHTRPDGSRFDSGLPAPYITKVGENLNEIWGIFRSPEHAAKRLVDSWMNSESHRMNILNPSYKEIGIGIGLKEGGKPKYPYYGYVYAAQIFYLP